MKRWWLRWKERKQPRVKAEPGQVLYLTDSNGFLVHKLVLHEIRNDYRDGVSVVFTDYSKFLQRTVVNQNAEWPRQASSQDR